MPVTRIVADRSVTLKILFRDQESQKKRFRQARLVVIFENLSKRYDTSPPRNVILSKLILDAKLFDLNYLRVRLPQINLCDLPFNLVTVLLQTKRGLFSASRAFFVPVACHHD